MQLRNACCHQAIAGCSLHCGPMFSRYFLLLLRHHREPGLTPLAKSSQLPPTPLLKEGLPPSPPWAGQSSASPALVLSWGGREIWSLPLPLGRTEAGM